jgi:hypothetical protein
MRSKPKDLTPQDNTPFGDLDLGGGDSFSSSDPSSLSSFFFYFRGITVRKRGYVITLDETTEDIKTRQDKMYGNDTTC